MATKSIGKSKVVEAIKGVKEAYLRKVNPAYAVIRIELPDGSVEQADIMELYTFDDTPMGVRAVMAKVAAQVAYYGNIKSELDRAKADIDAAYQAWYNDKYLEICREHEKGTETFKKASLEVKYGRDFEQWQGKLRKLAYGYNNARTVLAALEVLQAMVSGINATIRSEQELFNRSNQ